jgi:hypothetical protein
VLIGERGEHELIAVEPSPYQGDVRLPIRIEGDEVTERPGSQEIAD